MGSELARREPGAGLQVSSFDGAYSLAERLAKAGDMIPRQYKGNPSAIMAAIIMGKEMGFGPMMALRSIHVVEGKPEFSADVQLALMIQGGVRHQWTESTDKRAVLKLEREGAVTHVETFTIEDARAADLSFKTRNGGKGMWTKYPKAMLRARCVSAAGRAFCPDLLRGIYADGEISDEEQLDEVPLAKSEAIDVIDADVESAPLPTEEPREFAIETIDGRVMDGAQSGNATCVQFRLETTRGPEVVMVRGRSEHLTPGSLVKVTGPWETNREGARRLVVKVDSLEIVHVPEPHNPSTGEVPAGEEPEFGESNVSTGRAAMADADGRHGQD